MPTNNNVKRCKHGRNFCLECHGGTEWQLHATPAGQVHGERKTFIEWLSGKHSDLISQGVVQHYREHEHVSALACKARAALSAPPAAGVPEGWKLVPIEPTAEMVQAALDKPAFDPLGDLLPWSHITRTSYAAMIKAAPTPPASEQQQAVVLPEPFMFVKLHAGDVMDWTQDFSLAKRWTEEGNTVAELYSGHDLHLAYEK